MCAWGEEGFPEPADTDITALRVIGDRRNTIFPAASYSPLMKPARSLTVWQDGKRGNRTLGFARNFRVGQAFKRKSDSNVLRPEPNIGTKSGKGDREGPNGNLNFFVQVRELLGQVGVERREPARPPTSGPLTTCPSRTFGIHSSHHPASYTSRKLAPWSLDPCSVSPIVGTS